MREKNHLRQSLLFLLLLCVSCPLFAQSGVTFDNNAQTQQVNGTAALTVNNFSVPSGTDRLLVVVFSTSTTSSYTPPQITFGGTQMQQGAFSNDTNDGLKTLTYILPLGSGGNNAQDIVVGQATSSEGFQIATAFSLQFVNQTSPVETMADQLLPNNNMTNLNLMGTTQGSMIIESLTFSSSVDPSGSMPQSGQTIIENNQISPGLFPLVSFLSSPGGAVNLGWVHGGFNGGVNTAVSFDFSGTLLLQGNEMATTNEDMMVTTPNVLVNNTDADGMVNIPTPPTLSTQGGTVTFNSSDSTFTYTSAMNFNGQDTILYTVCDDVMPVPNCVLDSVFITVNPQNDPPTKGNENLNLTEDDPTTTTTNVLANNMDIDGDLLTVTSPPTMSTQGATVSFNLSNSTFNYTPITNFCGMDTILYMVCDNSNLCINDTIFINVACVNDPPTQGNENLNINEDDPSTATPNVLANNMDIDGNPLLVNSPPMMSTQGALVIFNLADSTFSYTPRINFCGRDSILYMVCDNSNLCINDTVFINIICVNDSPTQGNENLNINEDDPTTATPNVLANNMDIDGDPLAVTSPPTMSTQGAAVIFNATDSTFNYTPITNFCGMDSIPYMVCDNSNVCVNDTVFINVACVNDRPTQGNENLNINEDDPTTITPNLLANNIDIDGDPLAVTSPPTMSTQGATVSFNLSDSTFKYTPITNFCGMDSIPYMVCDNSNVCVNDTVFINVACVNDRPTQGNENLNINEDDPTTITPNLLANNIDIDGDPLAVTSPPTMSTQGATVSFNLSDSTFSYTPITNFCGMDTIPYMVCDNSNICVNDTVFINVACVNDRPTQGNENLNINEDDPTTATPNVLANNMDIDGDPITVNNPPMMSTRGATVNFNLSNSTFNYTPVANFCGMDSILYMVCDNSNLCVNDTVFINVACVNDLPTQGNENLSINEDAPTTATPNVLANNMDIDGGPLTVTSPPTMSTQGATVSFNLSDSTFSYTPIANFCGMDSILYMVCDNSNLCVNDTVFINVACVNDLPTQGNENLSINEDAPTTATPNVLANNMDIDGGPLTVTSPPTMSTQGATVSFNLSDSTFSYTPIANFCGMDSILYMVCDNSNFCVNDTVFINITCVNDPPTQRNINLSINEDAPTTITPNILANNKDIDGDPLTVTNPPTMSTQGATVSFNLSDSTFSYTPIANFCGMDTIPYMVCDNSNVCVNDTVFVSVTCVNDLPTKGNENLNIIEDDPATTTPNVLANNTDIDGNPVTITTPPTMSTQGGIVSFNLSDSTFNYTPAANFCGKDSILYMVCDNSDFCVNDTVFINITCVNDPPNQGNENFIINENAPITATSNVLINNIDPDGDPINVTSPPIISKQGATVSFNLTDSTFSYTPITDFIGLDSIIYMVCDNSNLCVSDTVFVEVANVPAVPVEPIPTMGEWALIIFGLLILNLSLLVIRRLEQTSV